MQNFMFVGSLDEKSRKVIEHNYDAYYMGDWSIKTGEKDQFEEEVWSERPYSVFYQPVLKLPSHHNYFTIYRDRDTDVIMIGKAEVFSSDIGYIECPDTHEILVSRYRHDYSQSTASDLAIDGGRHYTRVIGPYTKIKRLKVVGPDFYTEEGNLIEKRYSK